MINLAEKAKTLGFHDAAVMDVKDLVIVPEYRKFCEDNLCGNYNKLKACPPDSGSVEEMSENVRRYDKALILNTVVPMENMDDSMAHKEAKRKHNVITEKMMNLMKDDGIDDILMMAAGPWKTNSCMSAYCVDAQKMAEAVGMKCWEDDGNSRYFSLLLFV